MKKLLFSIALLALCSISAIAQQRPYSITLLGEYGYNKTWEHFGGAELRAFMPFNEHVETTFAFEGLSSNMYTLSGTIRPKFPLPVGEMFVDASVLYSAVQRNRIHDFAGALSLGYRMDYVDFQVGCFSRSMVPYNRMWPSEDEIMTEPFNLLYRLSFNVRPLCENWNLFFGMTNFTELEFERMWQPIFFMKAYYEIKPKNNFQYDYHAADHFRILAEIYCKPAGMFHLDASFYGIKAKVGVMYKF